MLKYNDNASKTTNFSNKDSVMAADWGDPTKTLEALITVNCEDGVSGHVSDISQEVLDGKHINPLMGDNNDGITVVDFTVTGKPAYCLANINEGDDAFPSYLVPMTAQEYMDCYKEDKETTAPECKVPQMIKRIQSLARPMTKTELCGMFPSFKSYWAERNALKDPLKALLIQTTGEHQSNRDLAEKIIKGEPVCP